MSNRKPVVIFNLKRKWYDLIKAREKTVEYRELKPYWNTRLSRLRSGDPIEFRLGYSGKNAIRAEFTELDIGECPYEGYNGQYIRIKFKLT